MQSVICSPFLTEENIVTVQSIGNITKPLPAGVAVKQKYKQTEGMQPSQYLANDPKLTAI
jgi:hypothetical protein